MSNTGAIVSLVNEMVCDAVAVLPQESTAVHVLVTENVQPAPVSGLSLNVAVSPVEQLSVTLATPKAALISAGVGLQVTTFGGVSVITGAVVSLVNVMVCDVVPILPQESTAVHVLVTEKVQPAPVSGLSLNVALSPLEQLSVTLATPKAALISAGVGLHVTTFGGVSVITGAIVSEIVMS